MKLIYSIFFITCLAVFNCSVSATETNQSKIEMTSFNLRSVAYILLQSEADNKQTWTEPTTELFAVNLNNTDRQVLGTTKARED